MNMHPPNQSHNAVQNIPEDSSSQRWESCSAEPRLFPGMNPNFQNDAGAFQNHAVKNEEHFDEQESSQWPMRRQHSIHSFNGETDFNSTRYTSNSTSAYASNQFAFTEFELQSVEGRMQISKEQPLLLSTHSPNRSAPASTLWQHSKSDPYLSHASQNVSHRTQEFSGPSVPSSGRECKPIKIQASESLDGTTTLAAPFRMTRVDWRWAADKGFWDKDKKCWIQTAGGQAAYIQQRSKRIEKRAQRKARQSKEAERAANHQPMPFRTGIMEELPPSQCSEFWNDTFQLRAKSTVGFNPYKSMVESGQSCHPNDQSVYGTWNQICHPVRPTYLLPEGGVQGLRPPSDQLNTPMQYDRSSTACALAGALPGMSGPPQPNSAIEGFGAAMPAAGGGAGCRPSYASWQSTESAFPAAACHHPLAMAPWESVSLGDSWAEHAGAGSGHTDGGGGCGSMQAPAYPTGPTSSAGSQW